MNGGWAHRPGMTSALRAKRCCATMAKRSPLQVVGSDPRVKGAGGEALQVMPLTELL
jgi:hypothetical protein